MVDLSFSIDGLLQYLVIPPEQAAEIVLTPLGLEVTCTVHDWYGALEIVNHLITSTYDKKSGPLFL